MMEYSIVAIMGASTTQLSRLDTIQKAAATLCHAYFIPLQRRCHAATVGLLLKLLDCHCHELLQTFVLIFHFKFDITYRSSILATCTQPYLLADIIVYNSLVLVQQSFLGSTSEI